MNDNDMSHVVAENRIKYFKKIQFKQKQNSEVQPHILKMI